MELDYSIINNLLIGTSYYNPRNGSINQFLIEELMQCLTISSNVLSMVRNINGNNIEVQLKKDLIENEDIDVSEINSRIKKIKGINEYFTRVASIPFKEFCVHEKIYGINEKTGNLELVELVYLPNQYVCYDLEMEENGWYIQPLNIKGNTEGIVNEKGVIPLTSDKFIIDVYNPDIDFPMGYGLFRYGILKEYYDYLYIKNKINETVAKYGSIIPVFSYNPKDIETEEGRKSIERKADALQVTEGIKALAIPLGTYTKTLKEGFSTISLTDLNLDMHITMMEKIESKIEIFLTSARFSKTDTGSQAKDSIMQDEKEKMIKELSRTVITAAKRLIKFDSELFGYDDDVLEPVFVENVSEETTVELQKKKLENEKIKLDSTITLSNNYESITKVIADMKFRKIENEKISEILGINEVIVENIEASEYKNTNNSTNTFISEFSKKKT
jgi:hypothetical protein